MNAPQIITSPVQRLRIKLQRAGKILGGRYWFPHAPLAALLALAGGLVLRAGLGGAWRAGLLALAAGKLHLQLRALPPVFIGGGMVTMGLGLLWRSRLSWLTALLLTATAIVYAFIGMPGQHQLLAAYFAFLLACLALSWRSFDRSSLTASTLFAFTSVFMLLVYATFGAYYLGAKFKPPITSLVTALYYAMVTMSTVGYGDIIPQTAEARLFTISIIVLGMAVFATSLSAVVAPLVTRSFQRIVNRRSSSMKRENHFVVVGSTPLAANTARELAKRGLGVTRVIKEGSPAVETKDADVVSGDPSTEEVLREAGAHRAAAVLAMLSDDSENAFVVLAVKELAPGVRTLAAVNDAHHLSRVKLAQPDVVIAPQVLGGELTAMLLSGEQVTPDFVMQRVFLNAKAPAGKDA
ncbi:MAG TPA: voltage-gated potassium channel protein [Elusimicrobiota bacterium]|nr:voltage-gated potassium channel protein [Elusimicrobiota bacterium]